MITFTPKELRFADAAVNVALSDNQRAVWTRWYKEGPSTYADDEDAREIPREISEVLFSGIEIVLYMLNRALDIHDMDGDTRIDTIEDIRVLMSLEQELRAGLSDYTNWTEFALAVAS